MPEQFFGLTLTRTIPAAVWSGILTGKYSICGGVIRNAISGQIVRHLIPVAASPITAAASGVFGLVKDAFTTLELQQISSKLTRLSEQNELLVKTTASVLHVAQSTMALSGLNLALGSVSFAVLNGKLNKLDQKLAQIAKHVVAIREFLKSDQRADLLSALSDLADLPNTKEERNKEQMLHGARKSLSKLNLFYRQALSDSSELQTALAYEELYCLTALAQVRCTAELGELDLARDTLEGMNTLWKEQARRIADKLIIRNHPERFLAQEFAKELPAARIAAWLDFAYNKDEGMNWIDDLRSKSARYYQPRVRFGLPMYDGSLIQDNNDLIPALNRLVTRNAVFEGYRSQYAFLTANNIKPTQFDEEVGKFKDKAHEGYLILGKVSEEPESL